MASTCHAGLGERQGGFGYVRFGLRLQQAGPENVQQDRACGEYEELSR